MRKVDVLGRRLIFDDFFKIEEAQLRYERYDGHMSDVIRRLSFERSDSAAALLVNAERGSVYLTEQFKYPTLAKAGGWIVEVLAGSIEPGETPEQALKREILEESGFDVSVIQPVGSFFVSPGGSSERIFLYCAVVSDSARKSVGGGLAAEGEDIKMLEWPIDEFLSQVASGQLQDAKTLVAGYWLKDNLASIV